MLTKQAATYTVGSVYAWSSLSLSQVICNTQHKSTREKVSHVLFGMDCCSPTEAALLPSKHLTPTDISNYREEMVTAISTARALALKVNQQAQ